jgi:23S rRNA (adenine2503-C2)-methyltransferase
MPVSERYPLSDVLDVCRAFYERKRRRIFVEYVMLAGVNDRYEQAVALARLLAPKRHGLALTPGAPTWVARGRGAPPPGAEPNTRDPQVFKVNLIPYNPIGGRPAPHARPASGTGMMEEERYKGSSREAIEAFRTVLQEQGIEATVRLTRGRDIDAACGQLAASAGQPVA